jgi:3-oxoacyl-[acyl-carrier-protein] synthase III
MDINAACTGWVYGVQVANALIQTGVYKHILIVGTEMTSSFNNWEDRSTCILFGDGSGAVVLSRTLHENLVEKSLILYLVATVQNLIHSF